MKKNLKCPYLIGITGCSGSGKTFVIEELKKEFGKKIVVISQDNYYKDISKLEKERWERADYDRPEAFDNDLLVRDLTDLKKGKIVTIPVYDFKTSRRLKEEIKVDPAVVIIVEGLFIFNVKGIRRLLDYKIFLYSDGDLRLARRLLRDINERGESSKNIAQSIQWYLESVKPNQEKWILPMTNYADRIINTNAGGRNAVEHLKKKIRDILEDR